MSYSKGTTPLQVTFSVSCFSVRNFPCLILSLLLVFIFEVPNICRLEVSNVFFPLQIKIKWWKNKIMTCCCLRSDCSALRINTTWQTILHSGKKRPIGITTYLRDLLNIFQCFLIHYHLLNSTLDGTKVFILPKPPILWIAVLRLYLCCFVLCFILSETLTLHYAWT